MQCLPAAGPVCPRLQHCDARSLHLLHVCPMTQSPAHRGAQVTKLCELPAGEGGDKVRSVKKPAITLFAEGAAGDRAVRVPCGGGRRQRRMQRVTKPETLTTEETPQTPACRGAQVTKLCEFPAGEGGDSVCSVSWSQRGTFLSVGTNNGEVQIWDVAKVKLCVLPPLAACTHAASESACRTRQVQSARGCLYK